MTQRNVVVALGAVVALSAFASCKGKDLTAMKTQALALVDKYKTDVEQSLGTVTGLIDKSKELPQDMPIVSGLLEKLTAQKDNLTKIQVMLRDLPAQVEDTAKGGKEEELKRLMDTIENDVGGGVSAATTVIESAQRSVVVAENEIRAAKIKDDVKQLGEKLGTPLKVQCELAANLLTGAKAMPPETAGIADLVKALEAAKAEGDAANQTLAAVPDRVAAAGNDLAAVQVVIDTASNDVSATTKKLETELPALEQRLVGLGGAAAKPPPAPEVKAEFAKALSTGFEVKGAGDGIETELITFVEDATKPVDKTTWFDFDRLTFQTGSATLDLESSKEQLTNIVEIMKAFPKLQLKIGGYTDNTGNRETNLKLSQQRADAVVQALVEAGVAPERLAAEGYGPDHPVCAANDTPECQAQNRRIAVRVTAK